MSFSAFASELGKRESGGDYTVVNKFGFLGKYQFGKARLYDLGYSLDGWRPGGKEVKKLLSKKKFLSDPDLQEKIFVAHVKDLRRQILKRYSDYLDKEIHGVYITLSGLIAGAHLLGVGGVSRFLKHGEGQDGFGTQIKEYVKRFADFDLTDL